MPPARTFPGFETGRGRQEFPTTTMEEASVPPFDPARLRESIREATTEDLLDRVTVYRAGMEEDAIPIIERELWQRGVNEAELEAHERQRRQETIPLPDGTVVCCSYCYRPAVRRGWSWHRLWGRIPLFPRVFAWCTEHQPAGSTVTAEDDPLLPS